MQRNAQPSRVATLQHVLLPTGFTTTHERYIISETHPFFVWIRPVLFSGQGLPSNTETL